MKNAIHPKLYKIEDKLPESYKIQKLSSADFSNSLTSFLYEHFRGAIGIVTDGFPFGSVSVAPEGVAHLIRLILKEVYGEYKVDAEIHLGQGMIEIKIKHREKLLNLDYISKVAKKSGFTAVEEDEHTITFTIEVMPERRPVLYAVSAMAWYRTLIRFVIDE